MVCCGGFLPPTEDEHGADDNPQFNINVRGGAVLWHRDVAPKDACRIWVLWLNHGAAGR